MTEYVRNQIFIGALSGRVFFAPRVKVSRDNGDGTALMAVVGNKFDITDTFDRAMKERAAHLRREKRKARTKVTAEPEERSDLQNGTDRHG